MGHLKITFPPPFGGAPRFGIYYVAKGCLSVWFVVQYLLPNASICRDEPYLELQSFLNAKLLQLWQQNSTYGINLGMEKIEVSKWSSFDELAAILWFVYVQ